MKNIFIHIGTHKTGSTAIQRALYAGRWALRLSRCAVVAVPPSFHWMMRTECIDQARVAKAQQRLTRLLTALKHRQAERFVLRWEGFSGDPYTGYGNAECVAETLRKVTKGHHVTLVVFLRRQDQLVESLYTQRIHEGGSLGFRDFWESLGELAFDWDRHLSAFENQFGKQNIRVRAYDRTFLPDSESLIETFGELIDCPNLPTTSNSNAANAGYTRDALEIARLVNPHLDDPHRRVLRQILQEHLSKAPFEDYAFFGRGERRAVLQRYRTSNQRVADRYRIGFPDQAGSRRELFAAPALNKTPDEYPGLNVETASRVLVDTLLHLRESQPRVPRAMQALSRLERAGGRALRRFMRPDG